MKRDPKLHSAPLIALTNCSVILNGHRALDSVNFDLRDGERWALVGPNGSGKTLLLKLLRGDVWPTPLGDERREYLSNGEIIESPSEAKERIAYVGPERQDRYVRYGWNHTVTQVVTTGLFDEEIPRTRATGKQRLRVAHLLKKFQLWSLRDRGFLTLSYGQRRRALVARAVVSAPQVLLLDEVFNGLDALSSRVLRNVLSRKRGVGSTWIVTTHRPQDVPSNVTHVARMTSGRLEEFALSSARKEALSLTLTPASRALSRNRERVERYEFPSGNAESSPSPGSGRGLGEGALIRLRNVDLYRDYRLVLKDVNWTISRGEHWAIFGRNGSGKSTLLKLLYGDLHLKLGGTVERDGVPFGTPISNWKRRVGFVSPELQADYFLARDLTEVVMSGRYSSIGMNEAPTAADRREAWRWLRFFGLGDIAHRAPRAVSYGQMRLALLARAMINKPELLLLDEPCTGLDVDVRTFILRLLERLAKQGIQLVMAVHERSDVPRAITHELAIQRDRTVEQKVSGES